MLTIRSSLIVAVSVALLSIAILQHHEALALMSLAFLIWVLFEWILFQRLMFASRRALLDCVRRIDDQDDELVTMVTDRIYGVCLLYTSPSPRDQRGSRMPSSA